MHPALWMRAPPSTLLPLSACATCAYVLRRAFLLPSLPCHARRRFVSAQPRPKRQAHEPVEDESPPAPYYPDFRSAMDFLVSEPEPCPPEDDRGLAESSAVWRRSSEPTAPEPHMDATTSRAVHTSMQSLQTPTGECVYRASAAYQGRPSGARSFSHASASSARTPLAARSYAVRLFSTAARRMARAASPYDLLGVPRTASVGEIKSKYYDLVKTLHPDHAKLEAKTKQEYERRVEEFRTVVKAYDLLKDPKTRAMYDRYGVGWESGAPTQQRPTPRGPAPMPRQAWDRAGQNRPFSEAEWAHWQMWSEAMRRANYPPRSAWPPRSESGWQHTAQGRYSYRFYGFPEFNEEEARQRATERMPRNQQILAFLFAAAWFFTLFQFERANTYTVEQNDLATRNSADVARNLEQARVQARSDEGQKRQRALMERVRRSKERREDVDSFTTPPAGWPARENELR